MTLALWFLAGIAFYVVGSVVITWTLDHLFGPVGKDD